MALRRPEDADRNLSRRPAAQSQLELALPGRELLPRGRLQQLQLGLGARADPRCSICRAPRRIEYTICTA